MGKKIRALFNHIPRAARDLTPEQMGNMERWYALERQSWDDRIRFVLIIFAGIVFCIYLLWLLDFLDRILTAEDLSASNLKVAVTALGVVGSGWLLQPIYRYYFHQPSSQPPG